MNAFAPYDPNTKPDTTVTYSTPIRLPNQSLNPISNPKLQEATDYNPPIARRTIRVDKPTNTNMLNESRDSRDSNIYTFNNRYKDSQSLNNGRKDLIYGDNRKQSNRFQPMTPTPNISNSPMLDPEALKQLLNLQLQLQQNPNIIQQTQNFLDNIHSTSVTGQGSIKSQNNNLVHAMTELEREVGSLRIENSKYKQTINDLEYELDTTKQQLAIEKNKTDNLNNELESHQDIRDKLDEYILETQKLESERDFHHKNHIELRKELYNKTSAEFQINKLKRDLFYKGEELSAVKERCTELELQINELLVFAEKPRNEKQANSETFYTKKIVELESTIKKLKDEKFEIENFHNTSFDRRALLSEPNIHKFDKSADFDRLSKFEIEALKKKVDTLKSENEYIKKQLENARSAKNADNISFSGEEAGKYQQMLKGYTTEIEELKTELRRLKSNPAQPENSRMEDFYIKTIEEQKQKISSLQQEKTALQIKIDTLNRDLMQKNREISDLKEGMRIGGGDDNTDQLREANKRMTMEIGRLQDQLRRLDSFNKTSMMSSGYKDRDWNKLLK